MDVILGYMGNVTVIGSSELKFKRLSKIVKFVLIIPYSIASEERVFSLIRKNKTTF